MTGVSETIWTVNMAVDNVKKWTITRLTGCLLHRVHTAKLTTIRKTNQEEEEEEEEEQEEQEDTLLSKVNRR